MRWKTAIREESWDDVLLVHVNDRELLFVLLGCPSFIFLYLDLNFWLTPTLLILEKFIISSGLICKTWVFDFVWEGFYFSLEKQNNFFFLSSLGFKGKSSKKNKVVMKPSPPAHTHTVVSILHSTVHGLQLPHQSRNIITCGLNKSFQSKTS